MTIEEIVQRLDLKVHQSGRELLIQSNDIPALLDFLTDHKVRILGFEGFDIENGKLRPDIENIADFSNCQTWAESTLAARNFFRETSPNRNSHFAVVI